MYQSCATHSVSSFVDFSLYMRVSRTFKQLPVHFVFVLYFFGLTMVLNFRNVCNFFFCVKQTRKCYSTISFGVCVRIHKKSAHNTYTHITIHYLFIVGFFGLKCFEKKRDWSRNLERKICKRIFTRQRYTIRLTEPSCAVLAVLAVFRLLSLLFLPRMNIYIYYIYKQHE